MTTQVHSAGPSNETYRSQRWDAIVTDAGGDAYTPWVYGFRRATLYGKAGWWSAAQTIEASFFKFGCDDLVTVDAGLVSGDAITTFALFPKRLVTVLGITASIVGGDRVVIENIPPGTTLRLEVNNERGEPLRISAMGLKEDVPEGYVDYVDGDEDIPAGAVVRFGAGVWVLPDPDGGVASAASPPLFLVGEGATVYLDEGAVIVGNFDLRGSATHQFMGPGVISGEWATWEAVNALATFDEQFQCSAFFSYDAGATAYTNCTVRGPTVVMSPFYSFSGGFNHIRECAVENPWTAHSDAFKLDSDLSDDSSSSLVDCYAFDGDDVVDLQQYRGNSTISGNLLCGTNCVFLGAYWPYDDNGEATLVDTNYVRFAGTRYVVTPGSEEGGEVIKVWLNGDTGDEAKGRFNLTFRNLWVELDDHEIEDEGIQSRIISVANKSASYETPLTLAGVVRDLVIENMHVDVVPLFKSLCTGLDATSNVEMTLRGLWLGGTLVTEANKATYFTTNAYGTLTIDEVVGSGAVVSFGAPDAVAGTGTATAGVFGTGVTASFGAPAAVVGTGTAYASLLVLETGAGLATANSYISRAAAETYLVTFGLASEWLAATQPQQEEALIRATKYLDDTYGLRFPGQPVSTTQALLWPRAYAYAYDGNAIDDASIPTKLARMCAVVAVKHLQGTDLQPDSTSSDASVSQESFSAGTYSESTTYQSQKVVVPKFTEVDATLRAAGFVVVRGQWAVR